MRQRVEPAACWKPDVIAWAVFLTVAMCVRHPGRADRWPTTPHGCPGDCGAPVPRHQLACKPCWFRLPAFLREAVNAGYRRRATNPGAHRAALADAMRWYRDNPRELTP